MQVTIHDGECWVPMAAVRHWGVEFIRSLNGGGRVYIEDVDGTVYYSDPDFGAVDEY